MTGRAHGAKKDGAEGEVEVGVFHYHQTVVAAQLEQGAAKPFGHQLGHPATHTHRTGGGNQRQPVILHHRFADFEAIADHQAHDRRGAVRLEHLLGDAGGGDGGERGEFGGFPHHRIAADGRQGGVPRPNGDREVEGRNDADRTERMPLFGHAVLRPLGVHGVAVELARHAHRQVADVDHFLDFAEALGVDLAGFDAHQLAERFLVAAQLVAELADHFATFGRRPFPPGFESLDRGGGHRFVVGRRGLGHAGDQLAGGGIEGVEALASRGAPGAVESAGVDGFDAQLGEHRGDAASGGVDGGSVRGGHEISLQATRGR